MDLLLGVSSVVRLVDRRVRVYVNADIITINETLTPLPLSEYNTLDIAQKY